MSSSSTFSTRRWGHLLVDSALVLLGAALVVLINAAAPGPDVCAASLPTPGPCFADDRAQIALIAIVSVVLIVGAGAVANHLLTGRRRRITVASAAALALVVGMLGWSSLAYSYWIIFPSWQVWAAPSHIS